MRTATIMIVAALLLVSAMAMASPKEKEFVAPIDGTKGLLDCTNAIPVSCGDIYQGTTVGGAMNVSAYSCVGWTETGPEVVHELVLLPPNNYNVSAAITDLGADLDIYFLGSCDEDDCMDYGDSSVDIADLAPGTYYIVVDGYSGAESDYTLTITCTELEQPCCPSPVYCCVLDFNIQNCGWYSIPCDGASTWEWGVPTDIPAVACDDVEVTHVLGTTLAGAYPAGSGEIAAIGPIHPDASCYCLEICHYYDTESDSSPWDGGNVKVSPDNGATWYLITPARGYDGVASGCEEYYHPQCVCGESIFYGNSGGFVRDCFDLTDYAGQTLLVGLCFGSDDYATTDLGWYVKWVKLGGDVSPVEDATWGSIKAMYR